jgi:hypothetical protein
LQGFPWKNGFLGIFELLRSLHDSFFCHIVHDEKDDAATAMGLSTEYCMRKGTIYLFPLATCRLLLAACYLPPATCRLLLAACYLTLATCRLIRVRKPKKSKSCKKKVIRKFLQGFP